MSDADGGGPAFPIPPVIAPLEGFQTPEGWGGDAGMTLRDWFAGQALAGMCAYIGDSSLNAERSYRLADAMLTERSK